MDRQSVVLSGYSDMQQDDLIFQLLSLDVIQHSSPDITALPSEIQAILHKYQDVCSPPTHQQGLMIIPFP